MFFIITGNVVLSAMIVLVIVGLLTGAIVTSSKAQGSDANDVVVGARLPNRGTWETEGLEVGLALGSSGLEGQPFRAQASTVEKKAVSLRGGRRGVVRALLAVLACGGVLGASPAWASDVYVSNSGSNTISPFVIAADGSLSPVACSVSNCSTGATPEGVAVSPNGRFLYTTNSNSNSVSVFAIAADGSLSPVACLGSNCSTGTRPVGVAVSPNGRFLYTANFGSNTVSVFAIGTDGSLSPVTCRASCTTGAGPGGVAVSPSGRFLYTTNRGSGSVSVFSIAADGSLFPVACLPGNCSTGTTPEGVAVSPNGRFLYTTNNGSRSVSVFAIATDGSLSPVTCPASCTTGLSPGGVAVSPSGRFLYTTNRGSFSVSVFSIAADGSLSPVACLASNCTTGTSPEAVAVSPNGRFLYTTNSGSSTVSVFSIAADGSLSPVDCPASNCKTSARPGFQSVAITPDQAPTAAFTATPAPPGSASSFDASASSAAPGQSVARYDWDFGDGTTLANGGARPTHTYTAPGIYTVSLTVTDDAGCSTSTVFTGQTASCNGSPTAGTSHTITVAPVASAPAPTSTPAPSSTPAPAPATAPKQLKLSVSPRRAVAGKRVCYRFKATSGGRGVSGVRIRFTGHRARTSSRGRAKICETLSRRGTYKAHASKRGYRPATARVTIKPKPPGRRTRIPARST